jgi:hypothetical protein
MAVGAIAAEAYGLWSLSTCKVYGATLKCEACCIVVAGEFRVRNNPFRFPPTQKWIRSCTSDKDPIFSPPVFSQELWWLLRDVNNRGRLRRS